MNLFLSARFFTSVAQLTELPHTNVPEIAFAGRSNSGKSSVLNVLANHKRLAFSSKTPGRTQLLNFFELVEKDEQRQEQLRGFLVDLPGYGFARADKAQRAQWDELVGGYVGEREPLIGLVIVMDARRPFMPGDEALIEYVRHRDLALHIVLNKSDQLNNSERKAALLDSQQRIDELGPKVSTQLLSALKKDGVDQLRAQLDSWLGR